MARVPVDRVLAGPPTIMCFTLPPPSLIEGPAALQLALGRWDLGCVLGRAFLLPAAAPDGTGIDPPHILHMILHIDLWGNGGARGKLTMGTFTVDRIWEIKV